MTHRRRTPRSRSARRPRLELGRPLAPPALDLAEGFIAELHADDDPETRQSIRGMVLCAGELLHEMGCPGGWDALDPAEFLARMPARSPAERAELCLHLIGFTAWLALQSYVHADRPLEAAAAVLAAGTTEPVVRALCHGMLSSVDRPAS